MGSPVRNFTALPSPPATQQRKRIFEQGFPVHAHRTQYPSSHPNAGQNAGFYWVGNPTCKFNVKKGSIWNSNKEVERALASVCLRAEIKCSLRACVLPPATF